MRTRMGVPSLAWSMRTIAMQTLLPVEMEL